MGDLTPMEYEKWKLTVEFDPPGTGWERGGDGPYNEAMDFYNKMQEDFWTGMIEEEFEEIVKIEGNTVIAVGDLLDYFTDPIHYLQMHYVIKWLKLERQG